MTMFRLASSLLKTAAVAAAFWSSITLAQVEFPAASPRAQIDQKVGLTDIKVGYSRPSAKGRAIFGGLVPYGQVWRTGANAATTVTFQHDVRLEGNVVRGGTYALYSIPGAEEWTVILSNNTELWGATGYDPSSDALRFTVKPQELAQKVETFVIGFEALNDDGAVMHLDWEHVRVPIKIETTDDVRIRAALANQMPPLQDAGAGLLYSAAAYLRSHGGDLKQAQVWIDAAAERRPEAFWILFEKAQIEAARGDESAVRSARTALEKARSAGADNGMIYEIESFINAHS